MYTNNKIPGKGFRLVGLILGIIATTLGVTSVIFAALGMHQAHLCKSCRKGREYR